jgi:hypothetical protein
MRSFAEACPDAEKVKQLVSQLPWGHVIRLLQRVKETEVREWYVRESIEALRRNDSSLILACVPNLRANAGNSAPTLRRWRPAEFPGAIDWATVCSPCCRR